LALQILFSFNTMALVKFERKILTAQTLPDWREALRREGRKLVATNGCFDILHLGHATYLEQARQLGDALLVGLTSDANVRALKGPNRPVNCEYDRAAVLAALESVSGVYIFPERDARHFLELVRPDIYAKGGDYTIETINQDERRLLEKMGVRIALLGNVPGKSTTAIIARGGAASE
jgi:rfaE bifunctional protein nucleotidyltransferase chain/domain